LKRLFLLDFRNYASLDISLWPGISVFFGRNAQGKTNLLEACYYLSTLTSIRAERESDLARWGGNGFLVGGLLSDGSSEKTLEIQMDLTPAPKRRVLLDGIPVKRQEMKGLCPSVYFCPDDLYMIKGPSSMRRKFLDSLLSRVDYLYERDLSRYLSTVERRNVALKRCFEDASWKKALGTLTDLLISFGVSVLEKRLSLLERLGPLVEEAYTYISGKRCRVSYASSVDFPKKGLVSLEGAFRSHLERLEAAERARGITLVGPHRDDLSIDFDDKAFRYYASQGEQRSLVLALKMAEAKVLETSFGTKPLLLLDDVFSELDEERRSRLLSLWDFSYQILITSTDVVAIEDPRLHAYLVKDNTVTPA